MHAPGSDTRPAPGAARAAGEDTIDVTHRSTAGQPFGDAAGAPRRYQTFLTTFRERTVHGVDVRVRRVGGTGQSDVVVHLHAAAAGKPTGAPIATAYVAAASVRADWTTVHADLCCPGLDPDAAYAVVLGQRTPQAACYEWACAEVDAALHSGRWDGGAWVDESASGDGWLRVWVDDLRPLVRGEHASLTGLGFGRDVDETRRFEVVETFLAAGSVTTTVWGVDLKLRRRFGTTQSDLWVGLYATANVDQTDRYVPCAPLAWTTVPASHVGDDWTIVHVPLWWTGRPTHDRLAIVVGQVAPQEARYEWAVGGSYLGCFGKLTPAGDAVDESHFGSAWFRLWLDSHQADFDHPAEATTPDAASADVIGWRSFGGLVLGAASDAKRFQGVYLSPWLSYLGTLSPELVGVELRLRKCAGTTHSDVLVELYDVANGVPTGSPLATGVIPAGAVTADPWGSTHRVMMPCDGHAEDLAVVLRQRTPQQARYEWAMLPNPCARPFGRWNGTAWVDERRLGTGWIRVWARHLWP